MRPPLRNGKPGLTRRVASRGKEKDDSEFVLIIVATQVAFLNGPQVGLTWPNRGPTGAHMECCLGIYPRGGSLYLGLLNEIIRLRTTNRRYVLVFRCVKNG